MDEPPQLKLKPPQLKFEPETLLEFEVLPEAQSNAELRIENPYARYVAFKIKTTAPKAYLVKPNKGVVNPYKSVTVQICHIPQYAPKEQSQDRFLIQAAWTQSDKMVSREEWDKIAETSALSEKKLHVALKWKDTQQRPDTAGDGSGPLSSLICRPAPSDPSEFRQAYEQLVNQIVWLDKQKKQLEAELDESRQGIRSGGQVRGSKPEGFKLWQVAVLVLGVVAVLKLFHFL